MTRRKRAAAFFGLGVVTAFGLFWWWQPWDFDIVPRRPARPLPEVSPETVGLFERGKRILIVTAHPDDESFYFGGTLDRWRETGVELAFVLTTDGDKSYYGPLTNARENRRVRRRETLEVAKAVGTDDVTFLSFPDGRLRDTPELRRLIMEQIERFRPDIILAFDDRFPVRFSHSDHRRSGEAAVAAAQDAGFTGWLLLFQSGATNLRVDISDRWEAKERYLLTHRSQFDPEKMARLNGLIRGIAEAEGKALGVPLAEGFRAIRLVSGAEDNGGDHARNPAHQRE